MSLISLLSIARTALLTQQRAMTVTAHNIANAETPGYSRQRLRLEAATPSYLPYGTIGRGVFDVGIERARDPFFDHVFRNHNGLLGRSSTMQDMLGQIEASINEPSDDGVASALDSLFSAFNDLANDPTSGPNRSLVVSAATRFTDLVHRLDSDVRQANSDALTRMRQQTQEVNGLLQRVADLNTQILSAGGPDHTAPDLQDQRDQLIDQLSQRLDVRVLPQSDGTLSVLSGDAVLVQNGEAATLSVNVGTNGIATLNANGGSASFSPSSGSLSALLDLVNVHLPEVQQSLDTFAGQVVSQVNSIHRSGYTANGETNVDFFDPAGVTARSISLSTSVRATPSNIAAGGTAASGDGAIALQISGLANERLATLGDATLGEFYIDFTTALGLDVQSAVQDASSAETLVASADEQRLSVSGVSIDEEMTTLITQQQAYSAAARLIEVANQMMQDLMQAV